MSSKNAASFYLDCRPLSAVVSPFLHSAKKLREATYPDKASVDRATTIVKWLEYLGKRLPWIQTADPLEIATLTKAASDADFRARLLSSLATIEAEIQKAAQATPQPQPGYKIGE